MARVALITGGGTGIGAAIARLFKREGGEVVLMGRRLEPLEATANEIGAAFHVGDASSGDDVDAAIALAVSRYGGLDVLVANAGGLGGGRVTDTTDAGWDAAWRTNVTTAFVSARAAMPELQSRRGSIVIISSIAGLAAGPEVAGYVTAKHALIGLTRSLARDYGPEVRVNALCPGWVRTPMADEEMDALAELRGLPDREAAYALATRDCPLRRPAEPDEIASVACFLASGAASAMTGSVVVVDSGAGAVDLPTIAYTHES